MNAQDKPLLKRFYLLFLLMGDVTIFILTLLVAIGIRFGFPIDPAAWELHRGPFSFVLLIFLFCLVIGDFYNIRRRYLAHEFIGKVIVVFLLFLFLTFTVFYFSPFFTITPKRILLLQTGLLLISFYLFRSLMMKLMSPGPIRWILFSDHELLPELLSEQRRLKKEKAYELLFVISDNPRKNLPFLHPHAISGELLSELHGERVVTADETTEKEHAGFFFRELIPRKIRVQKFSDFFEEVCEKVPVEVISESWFLENLDETRFLFYDRLKRIFDMVMVLVLAIPAALFSAIITMAILLERKSDIFYSQRRMKKGGETFLMWKFASMRRNAESLGPQWSITDDPRVTTVGKLLRRTHLDELAQLWNILRGDMTFIGPRPERPEFVEMLKNQIPFYYQRFLVKPGLSGWAQIHYPYGATVEDALKKLQYELYYIKHRSVLMDLEILLRTFRLIFSQSHR